MASPREADPPRGEGNGAAGRGEPRSRAAERSPGWLRALVVGGVAVDVGLVAAAVTFLLPRAIGDVVFRSPLLIVVLIVGTAAVLWTITRPNRVER